MISAPPSPMSGREDIKLPQSRRRRVGAGTADMGPTADRQLLAKEPSEAVDRSTIVPSGSLG